MSEPTEKPVRAERREAAAAWLVRLEGADAGEGDWLAFEQWLGDPENKRALDEIDAALAILEDHSRAFRTPPRARPAANQYLRLSLFLGLAAAVGALLIVQLRPTPPQTFIYEAPANAARTLALPDGGEMTLNRGAVAEVQWSANLRRVSLNRGEAAFRIVHNTTAPFTVLAGAASINDVGTEFDVLRTSSGVRVTVREGSVSVVSAAGARRLSPGDQVRIEDRRIALLQTEADDAFAWREGRLVYRDAPLMDVVADLNRYSATPISVAPDAASLRFSGVLIIDSPTAMIARLEAFLPVHSEHNGNGIVIRSR